MGLISTPILIGVVAVIAKGATTVTIVPVVCLVTSGWEYNSREKYTAGGLVPLLFLWLPLLLWMPPPGESRSVLLVLVSSGMGALVDGAR